ncbi:MAG: ABC transporter substrate-binding protein [Actinocatenispora sp.]
MYRRRLITALVAALALLPALTACDPDKKGASGTVNGMVANLNLGGFTSNPNPQRVFNPYLPSTTLDTSYIFEPLFVVNGYNCKPEPWLGTSFSWDDPEHLSVTTRHGVTWSDGKSYSAKDVAFSFNLLKKVPAFDQAGVWASLKSVEATGSDKVLFTFKHPSADSFTKIANLVIVPEHVWSTAKDPVKFTNPNGVGTGPFRYASFNSQQMVLKRNTRYWRADKVKVAKLTFHNNGGGGDTDKLRLAQGQYDQNTMFVADIEKTFVSRDPKHNKYWFNSGGEISLYLNLTRAPFNDTAFRHAIAYAVNRKEISQKAEYGYVKPASQTGLVLPGQKSWLSDKYADGAVTGYDPARAKRMFTAAGYKYSDGKLLDKSGKPMAFTFDAPTGWLDWIQAANIVRENLGKVGIDVDVRTADANNVQNDRNIGHFDMQFGVHGGTCNMFQNFDEPLGSDKTAPIGKAAVPAGAGGNFVRWRDERTDQLLEQLRSTTDVAQQKKIIAGLQDVFVQQIPVIPLWYGAQWYEYRTANAVGWPNKANPYAVINQPNNALLVITRLQPAQG